MRRTVGGILVAAALTACGTTTPITSTVQQSDGLSPTGPAYDGSASGTTGLGGSTSTGAGGTSSGTTGLGTTGGSTTGATTGLAGTTGGTTGATGGTPTLPPAARTGRGVTAKTITLGFAYTANADSANSAIGAGAVTAGDDQKTAQALVDEINEKGGVAGRKLVLKKFGYDATSTAPAAQQDQQACSAYTDDAEVLAVVGGNLTEVLLACLHKKGIPLIKSGVLVDDDTVLLRKYPGVILLAAFAQDRALADTVRSLVRQSWFTGWNSLTGQPAATKAKVGVISYDPPQFQRSVNGTLLPALKAAGYPVAGPDVAFVHKPENQSDVSRTVAGIKSASLKLQQDGVTHLVFNDANGILMGLFASNARTQGYYPRYGLTTGSGPQAIHDTGLVSSEQLRGMGGNSWLPFIDLLASESAKYATSSTKRCFEILKRRTGVTYKSTNEATIALGTCDQFFLVTQALNKATALTALGLVQSIESLGSAYVSTTVPGARIGPDKHDAAAVAWDITWHEDCSCIRYSSRHAVP